MRLQRVFKYASNWDFLAYAAGFIASVGAGITLPLMNVVFGKCGMLRLTVALTMV